jgi:hypothetical protein
MPPGHRRPGSTGTGHGLYDTAAAQQYARLVEQAAKEQAREEIRAFTYDLALQLKEWCELF